MIINGGSRSGWRFFAGHLGSSEKNERVDLVEIRGCASDNVLGALREMDALARGTRCTNFFYHANLNPTAAERLTPAQWEQAIDRLEANLGLTGHSRVIVEHEKDGRVHRHVLWSRIDVDTMTAVSDSKNYACHERSAREIETLLGLEPGPVGAHERTGQRPERGPENWETFRGHESGIDPIDVKAAVSELWRTTDNGRAFAAALEDAGYILAKGDRRDFVIVDPAGDEHSLGRRIEGAKAKDVRARMADVDREALPSVDDARELARARAAAVRETGDGERSGALAPGAELEQAPTTAPTPLRDSFERVAEIATAPVRAESVAPLSPTPAPDVARAASAPLGLADRFSAAHRAAEGAPPLPVEGSRWLDALRAAATPLPAAEVPDLVSRVQESMRAHDGEPFAGDGLGFWERAAARLATTRDRAASWTREALTETKDVFTAWLSRYLPPERDRERRRKEGPGFDR